MKPPFLTVDRTVFLIKHHDGFVSDTTRGAFNVSEARCDAKQYKSWQAALKMARQCKAEEIQEVDANDCKVITRRYAIA